MKKEYGLALGGGAARGLMHIGLYQYLLEKNIKIKEISGTSMGSIIGSCIATGMTPEDIIKKFKEVNYTSLIDIRINGIKGKKIYKELDKVFLNKKIEELEIPLKIIATNINTGEKKIFNKGFIKDAIRGSISIPGIFEVYYHNNEYYVDGGLVDNLPIGELKSKNIIASSAIRRNNNLKKINNKSNYFDILNHTIRTIQHKNEIESLKTKNKNILFVKYDNKYKLTDFKKIDQMVKAGYKEAKNILFNI